MDMAPMIWCGILWIDAEGLDDVDRFEHPLDFRPAGKAEQNFAAGCDTGDRRDQGAGWNGAQNVNA